MNKNEKLAKLTSLMEKIHPGEELRDIRRVYSLGKQVPSMLSAFIYAAQDDDLLVGKDPDYTLDAVLGEVTVDNSVWLHESDWDDFWIFKSQDIMALLDKLKGMMGPDPQRTGVAFYEDEIHFTEVRATTAEELDLYIEEAEEYLENDTVLQAEHDTRIQQDEQRRKIDNLVDRLGLQRALDLLDNGTLKE